MARFSLRRFLGLAPSASAPVREIGYQVSKSASWSDFLDESGETNKDLLWPNSIEIFDRMRREDPQVASVLRAVTQPIQGTSWELDPAGARGEVVEQVALDLGLPIKGGRPVSPLRTRGRFSWDEHLRLALLSLVFGHSYFEQVYRIEAGRAHLHKLAWRPPRTISEIKVARDGGLEGIRQYDVDELIGVDRLVAHVNEREGGNWLGTSLLRPAYKMWLLKDRGLRTQAMTLERNGLGVPVYTAAPTPDGVSETERDKWLTSEREAGLKVAKDFRAGDAAGASLPHGAELSLKGVDGRLPDTDKPIRYYDEQIARAVLANFLNLGGDNSTGSYALGDTFEAFFTRSLNGVAGQIADVTQQHVVEDLVDLNWGESEPAPRVVPAAIGEEQAITPDGLQKLIDSGVVVPDAVLETAMRARFRLPVKDENTARTAPSGADTEEAA